MSFLHIVLLNPEIPQNTGNIGRTCVALGATLHLVGEVGFSLDSTYLRRAGLDYWPLLNFKRHENWEVFLAELPSAADLWFFSSKGKTTFWEKRFHTPLYLVFGSESRGLPKKFYTMHEDKLLRIPMDSKIRSLNLATAVGIAAYEAARQFKMEGNK